MAGRLTTHVLDTARGVPAAGVRYILYRIEEGSSEKGLELARGVTDQDGRSIGSILEGEALTRGAYALEFDVAEYHRETNQLPPDPFLGMVAVTFQISDSSRHTHVPLLVSPFSYATYRGS